MPSRTPIEEKKIAQIKKYNSGTRWWSCELLLLSIPTMIKAKKFSALTRAIISHAQFERSSKFISIYWFCDLVKILVITNLLNINPQIRSTK